MRNQSDIFPLFGKSGTVENYLIIIDDGEGGKFFTQETKKIDRTKKQKGRIESTYAFTLTLRPPVIPV